VQDNPSRQCPAAVHRGGHGKSGSCSTPTPTLAAHARDSLPQAASPPSPFQGAMAPAAGGGSRAGRRRRAAVQAKCAGANPLGCPQSPSTSSEEAVRGNIRRYRGGTTTRGRYWSTARRGAGAHNVATTAHVSRRSVCPKGNSHALLVKAIGARSRGGAARPRRLRAAAAARRPPRCRALSWRAWRTISASRAAAAATAAAAAARCPAGALRAVGRPGRSLALSGAVVGG
jgi:hypothetical protein